MRNIIVTTTPVLECWGNFKKLCEAKKLPYHTLKKLKLPIFYKEYTIEKRRLQ
jgi:hypothetical protein